MGGDKQRTSREGADTVWEQMHACAVNIGIEPSVGSGFTGPLPVSSRQQAHVHFSD